MSLVAFALYDFFWRIVNPYSFHVLIKSAFLFFSAKAYCVHNKQNNSDWLLVVMKFLSPCLAQYLTHLLCSPVRCRVKYEKRNPISMRARVSFSVSLDQKKLWQMKRIDTTKRKKHNVYIQEGRTYSLRETWEAFCHFAAIFHKFIWFLRLGVFLSKDVGYYLKPINNLLILSFHSLKLLRLTVKKCKMVSVFS